MLVLSRKERESIIIRLPDGTEITVAVTSFAWRGGKQKVRIGISAPSNVIVFREELREQFAKKGV